MLKLFLAEAGSKEMVDHVAHSEDRAIFVSVLALLEVRSAIRRRLLLGDISPLDGVLALASAADESRRFVQRPLTETIMQLASDLIDRNGLRALDAIQLASGLLAKATLGTGDTFLFICSDLKLLRAAEREGIEVWNPAAE